MIVSVSTSAQLERSYYNYDSKDGLNASHIYGIVQDSKGFMWIGTSTGLIKFDGVSFKTINLTGLKNIEILQLKIDDQDNLWFVNLFNQLCQYSPETGLKIIDLNEEITLSNIWLKGDQLGVFRNVRFGIIFNLKTLERTELLRNNFKIPCINDDLFITQELSGEIKIIDQDKKLPIKTQYIFSPNSLFRFGEHLYTIASQHKNIYRLIKKEGAYYCEKVTGLPLDIGINGISELTDSLIYLNTNMGIRIYEKDFRKLVKAEFKNHNATGSIIDNENNLWVSSMNSGLLFSHYSKIKRVEKLNRLSVSKILKVDDFLYIGSNQGTTFILNQKNSIVTKKGKNEPVRFILDSENNTLVGFNTYIDYYHLGKFKKSKSYSKCQKDAVPLIDNKIMISTCEGYSIFEMNDQDELIQKDTAFLSRVFNIYEDKLKNEIIISALNGIHRYRISDGLLTKNIYPNVASYNIIDITGSQENVLWMATNSSGIIGVENGKIEHHFTNVNLLNSNSINDIFLDNKGAIWMGTSSGINLISPDLKTVSYITSKDGLSSDFVEKIYAIENTVYVGTSKGLNLFEVENQFSNATQPLIYLNSLLIDGENKELDELSGQENTFRFNFQGINYSSLGNFTYKYRLKGLTDKWEHVSSSINEAIYNKIPPGNYTFEVLAVNEDGIESEEPVRISFYLPKPIYFRWWFVLIMLCLIASLINWLFTRRLSQIKKRNALEMNLRSQQLVALKAQMKPHFISNILNSIQSHSMLQDPIKVNQYITRLSRFVRKVLNMSDSKVVALKDELEVIETYIELEQMRSNHSFEYQIDVDKAINQKRFYIPPMLIQPYVENAIKHGVSSTESGMIRINVDQDVDSSIIVTVEDNGLGINEKLKQKSLANHKSVGTEKNSTRLDLLRDVYNKTFTVKVMDISDHTFNKNGTKVQLIISNMSKFANA